MFLPNKMKWVCLLVVFTVRFSFLVPMVLHFFGSFLAYSADRAVYLACCDGDEKNIWILLNFLVALADYGLLTGQKEKYLGFILIGSLNV